jgi:hypothetical protein
MTNTFSKSDFSSAGVFLGSFKTITAKFQLYVLFGLALLFKNSLLSCAVPWLCPRLGHRDEWLRAP